jgi:hypothetical protein
MRVRPSSPLPAAVYKNSRLSKPPKELTFESFISRLRRFNRNGIADRGAALLWNLWQQPERLRAPHPDAEQNLLTRAYAERVIALGCTYASAHNRPNPTELDFQLLCRELHSVVDDSLTSAAVESELTTRLHNAVQKHPSTLLRKVEVGRHRHLLVEALKAKMVTAQNVGRRWGMADLFRPLLIARELRALGLKHGGEAYKARERAFFLMEMEEFVRCYWALLLKAQQPTTLPYMGPHGPATGQMRGAIFTRDWPNDPELEVMGLTAEAMRAVASRMSASLGAVRVYREQLESLPADQRAYAPASDWLSFRPLIDAERGGTNEVLLLPSPWRFLSALNHVLLYDFVESLSGGTALGGHDAHSLRGEAFEEYLRRVLKGCTTLHDLKWLKGVTGKRPDFAWMGEEYGVLIEAKFALRPNADRTLKNISAAVETWLRAAEPIEQAAGFLGEGLGKFGDQVRLPSKWVLAVVSDEPLIEDTVGFKSIAKANRLLEETGLSAIAYLTPTGLEDWVLLGSADDFARRAIELWEALDPYSTDQELNVERLGSADAPTLPHIETVRANLFARRSKDTSSSGSSSPV